MRDYRSGQSLIEILVAVGVGTIMLLGAITALAPVIKSSTDVNRSQIGAALGKELIDNLKVFTEANWHNLDSLATTSANKYFLVISTSSMQSVTGTEVVPSGAPGADLVGYWKLDEGAALTAADSSGKGHSGTVYGTVATSGFAGNARFFAGAGNYIDMGSLNHLSGNNFTVSFWAKTSSTSDYSSFIDSSIGGASNQIRFYLGYYYSSVPRVAILLGNGTTFNTLDTGYTIPPGIWVHYAVTVSSTQVIFYVDGKQYGSATTTSLTLAEGDWKIANGLGGTGWFNGWMDDVRIYNHALSASEIQTTFNATNFFRYFYVDDVHRDSSGNMVASGGGLDPSTKKITVEYYWGVVAPKALTVYLTRSGNRTLWQTDWTGGAGVNGPASTTGSTFSTSSAINFATSSGSIRIDGL
ncbi:MAG: putative transmembrane protein [Parcubacteria group bacterium LiPW_15]|nr:MAG: putative transmembrane protein [Parcubacteria group bacterium LiPW_15]